METIAPAVVDTTSGISFHPCFKSPTNVDVDLAAIVPMLFFLLSRRKQKKST